MQGEGKRAIGGIMKAELTLPQELVEAIADKVIEKLKPVIAGNGRHVPDDRWFNVKELAEYISMSSQWIYNNKNNLPHVNINSKPLFKKSDIDLWLESFRVNTENKVITFPVNAREQNKGIQNNGFNNRKRKAVTSL